MKQRRISWNACVAAFAAGLAVSIVAGAVRPPRAIECVDVAPVAEPYPLPPLGSPQWLVDAGVFHEEDD